MKIQKAWTVAIYVTLVALVLIGTGIDSCAIDADGDGYSSTEDCNDNDPTIHPEIPESCDGIDQNCNGQIDEEAPLTVHLDLDGDGYGDEGAIVYDCTVPEDYTVAGEDCNDGDPEINPGAQEVCDEVDQNCNGYPDDGVTSAIYLDADLDGFGDSPVLLSGCSIPVGYSQYGGDCDDAMADVYPGAQEACDGVDQDCDGLIDEETQSVYFLDSDGDGYGRSGTSLYACSLPEGYTIHAGDCNDSNPATNPDAPEICGDVTDNDCDFEVDEDCSPPCLIEGYWRDNFELTLHVLDAGDGSFTGSANNGGGPDEPPTCWWNVWGTNTPSRTPDISFYYEKTDDNPYDGFECFDSASAYANWTESCNAFNGRIHVDMWDGNWSVSATE